MSMCITGACFLQQFVKSFDSLLMEASYGPGKQIDNVLILIAHLYNFKVNICIYHTMTIFFQYYIQQKTNIFIIDLTASSIA